MDIPLAHRRNVSRDWKMGSKPILEERKIEETITNIPGDSFTVLDFIEALKAEYPEDWKRLVERFGLYGSKKRYTVTTYLSNRLDLYSHQAYSRLLPLTRFNKSKTDYRRPTKQEKEVFWKPLDRCLQKRGVNVKRLSKIARPVSFWYPSARVPVGILI